MAKINKFHEHLDNCIQCQNNPFDLCNIGQKLLMDTAMNVEWSGLFGMPDNNSLKATSLPDAESAQGVDGRDAP